MSRRSGRGNPLDEALGLFLDAISNGFGAILFIGMLVAVLLQLTGIPPAAPTPADAPPDAVARNELADELEQLRLRRAMLEAQIELYEDAPPEPKADSSAEAADLSERVEQLRSRETSLEAEQDRLKRQIEQARVRRRELEQQIERIEAAIDPARQAATQRIRLPRARVTAKQQVPVFLHDGRLILPYEYDPRGEPVAHNTSAAKWSDGNARVRPRPGRGVAIDPDDAGRVLGPLERFDPDEAYLELVVWPDSYAEAAALRDALVEAGYDYNLLLMKQGESVPVGAGTKVVQ
ncbi:MAG: hypothetical protein ACLFV3_11510 [Phycisphaeraceae bacterium]